MLIDHEETDSFYKNLDEDTVECDICKERIYLSEAFFCEVCSSFVCSLCWDYCEVCEDAACIDCINFIDNFYLN